MLKQRITTALILAPLAVWGIWTLSSPLFALVMVLIFLLGGWEWARLSGLQHNSGRVFYVALLGGMMYGAHLLLQQDNGAAAILVLALMWWTLALMTVLGYPQSSGLWRLAFTRGVAGVFILLPAWAAMVLLHREFGPGYVILLVMLVWGADIGAYFAGRAFGKHKLAPKVSPGKTREGVLGGMLLALAVAVVAALWLKPVDNVTAFLLLCVLTVAFSVLGDLVESLFKRIADVKDSGGLLPGHGGVMDRIDSLTAAAPVFTLGLVWLSR